MATETNRDDNEDNDVVEMDVHVQDDPDADLDLNW